MPHQILSKKEEVRDTFPPRWEKLQEQPLTRVMGKTVQFPCYTDGRDET